MKTSVIRYRVADFLKQSAPFDAISEEDLLELAATGRVTFHEAGEFVFRKSERRKPCLWVIQQGTVEIIDEADHDRLRDLLGAGDVLGLGYFLESEHYLHSARTASDVILYSIDAGSFALQVTKYPRVARFLAAHFSDSERFKDVLQTAFAEKLHGPASQTASWLDAEGPSREFLRTRLHFVTPEQPLREAVSRMTECHGEAVAVVDPNGIAIGIITDQDVNDRLASGSGSAEDTCDSIMRTQFQTAPPDLTAEAYLLQMMRSRSPILAVTREGGADSRLEGLLSDRELSFFTGRNPPLLMRELLNVQTDTEWKVLLQQTQALKAEALTGPWTFNRVAEIASLMDAAFAESVVRAAEAEILETTEGAFAAAVPRCWLLFGRAGRSELIEPLQPEIGVVYEDPPQNQKADVEGYFKKVGECISLHLAACGLEKSRQAGDEREVPLIRSASDWKAFFRGIISNPIENEIYATRRLLDFRVLCGDARLEQELASSILDDLAASRNFIPILANDTMEHLPPMTFFRGLVIEFDGAQTPTLDLGVTALGPIIDAARVYSLAAGSLDARSTLARLDLAAAATPSAGTVFHEAAGAFRVASYYAAVAAIKSPSRSPLIEPSQLTKYDQRLLKTTFESIQNLIEFTSTPSQWKRRM